MYMLQGYTSISAVWKCT